MNWRHCSALNVTDAIYVTFKVYVKIGSGYQISRKISLENVLIKLQGVLTNTLT